MVTRKEDILQTQTQPEVLSASRIADLLSSHRDADTSWAVNKISDLKKWLESMWEVETAEGPISLSAIPVVERADVSPHCIALLVDGQAVEVMLLEQ